MTTLDGLNSFSPSFSLLMPDLLLLLLLASGDLESEFTAEGVIDVSGEGESELRNDDEVIDGVTSCEGVKVEDIVKVR